MEVMHSSFFILHCSSCRSKQLIKDAVLDNDFLKNLDSTQVREIVDCMYEKQVRTGQYIIKEGEAGQHLFVSAGRGSALLPLPDPSDLSLPLVLPFFQFFLDFSN